MYLAFGVFFLGVGGIDMVLGEVYFLENSFEVVIMQTALKWMRKAFIISTRKLIDRCNRDGRLSLLN